VLRSSHEPTHTEPSNETALTIGMAAAPAALSSGTRPSAAVQRNAPVARAPATVDPSPEIAIA